jgi:hypothetical protein
MVAKKKVENLDAVTEVGTENVVVENVVDTGGCSDNENLSPDGGQACSFQVKELNSLYKKGAQVQMKGLEMAEKLLDDFGIQKPPYNEQQLKIAMTAMDLYNAFKA